MPFNPRVQQIVGKTIKAVIVKDKGSDSIRDIMYLLFTDNTMMDFSGEYVYNSKLNSGCSVHTAMSCNPTYVFVAEEEKKT